MSTQATVGSPGTGSTEKINEAEKDFPCSYHGSFSRGCRYGYEYDKHVKSMSSRFNEEYERRRDNDKKEEQCRTSVSYDGIRVEMCEFFARDNAIEHHTEMYEIVKNDPARPVYRRGLSFLMEVKFEDRSFDPERDHVRLIFNFGPNPSVPKDTKIVLPLLCSKGKDKTNQWEARVKSIEGKTAQIEVFIPADAPVGVWKCWIETSPDGFSDEKEDRSPCRRRDGSPRKQEASPRRKDEEMRKEKERYRKEADRYRDGSSPRREDGRPMSPSRSEGRRRRDDDRPMSPSRSEGRRRRDDGRPISPSRWEERRRRDDGRPMSPSRWEDKRKREDSPRPDDCRGPVRSKSYHPGDRSPRNYQRLPRSSSYRQGDRNGYWGRDSPSRRSYFGGSGSPDGRDRFSPSGRERWQRGDSPYDRDGYGRGRNPFDRDEYERQRSSSGRMNSGDRSSSSRRDYYRGPGSPYRGDGYGSPDRRGYHVPRRPYRRNGFGRGGSAFQMRGKSPQDNWNDGRPLRNGRFGGSPYNTSPFRYGGSPYGRMDNYRQGGSPFGERDSYGPYGRREGSSPYGDGDRSPYRRDGDYRQHGSPFRQDNPDRSSYNRDERKYRPEGREVSPYDSSPYRRIGDYRRDGSPYRREGESDREFSPSERDNKRGDSRRSESRDGRRGENKDRSGRREEYHRDDSGQRRNDSEYRRRDRSSNQNYGNRGDRNDERRRDNVQRDGSRNGRDRSDYRRDDSRNGERQRGDGYYRGRRDRSNSGNRSSERDNRREESGRRGDRRDGSEYRRDGNGYRRDRSGYRRDDSGYRRNSGEYRRGNNRDGSGYRGNRRDGSDYRRDGSNYRRDGSSYRRDDSGDRRDDSEYRRDGSGYRRDDSNYRRDGSDYRRDDSVYRRDRSGYRRDGSEYRRDGGDSRRDRSGYRRDDSEYRRDGGDSRRDRSGYRRDDSEYRRDGGDSRRDRSGYRRDGSDYRRDGSDYRRDGSDYRRDRNGYRSGSREYTREDRSDQYRYRNSPYQRGGDYSRDGSPYQRGGDYNRDGSPYSRDVPRESYYRRRDEEERERQREHYGREEKGERKYYFGDKYLKNGYGYYSHHSKNKRGEVFKCKQDIYILFNPWCKEDSTYMENDTWRNEYVLNDVGKVWVGTYGRNKGRSWVFGQFDDVVLPAVMYLLEEARMGATERANPVRVVRAISEMVNNKDYNNGFMERKYSGQPETSVMVGRWDGNYDDGISPYAWTGSVKILEQYLRTGRSVKYGQCWVFSAVTTTICRALGIPCRSVTNFVSAHDTNNSLCIDKYFSCTGDEIEGGPDGDSWDSVWNFHSWNDVWMARPDLPSGYGGWQAIDSTFQEESDGRYKCGPASLESIRRGEIGFCYDTPFLYSEVNAEVNHWQEDEQSEWGFTRMRNGNYHVGRQILTKLHDRDDDDGDNDVEDILREYRPKDGFNKEQQNVMCALHGVERGCLSKNVNYQYKGKDDVEFELVEVERVQIGQPFTVAMNMMNKSNDTRNVQAMLSCNSVYYTGVKNRRIKQHNGHFVLKPNQRESMVFRVLPEEYQDKIVDYAMIKIYAVANVRETKQAWGEEEDFYFERPRLSIQTRGNNRVKEEMEINFNFTNPLNVTLTNCRFSFEAPGMQKPKVARFRDVRPGEMVNYTEKCIPKSIGNTKIVGNFSSHQLNEVTGAKSLTIRE